ncbi:DUF971 domain-containing protein [Microbulbifer rhizosphaerae]|uniref:DUF971 family protein n=1 Tax=Microbulbifer rhizosphaerae TaxID=1562603 RepID=A0A7W4WCN7_9GAMM|nr:gamma-butyrobetaine hydroxylase-like domain-containing protein [Microbulbifer rhizosphaerae]MBB3061146.1 DUF971 family protein [Microbulbifer rhizosphaerae]
MNEVLYPPILVTLDKAAGELKIVWKGGEKSHIAGSELRRYCACSNCRARKVVGVALVTESTEMRSARLMGNNALQIEFSDGHDRGIYPWPYLFAIGEGLAQEYLDE